MKFFLTIAIIIFSNLLFGQNFKLFYADIGLGSNHGTPADTEVSIDNEHMILRTPHKISDSTIQVYQIPDTVGYYNTLIYQYIFDFRRADIDSIGKLIDTLSNKKVICSNPFVRSGGMYKLLINNNGLITEFSMTNTFDSTALSIINILNAYFPEENHIYYPKELWEANEYKEPLIRDFEQPGDGNSREAYENEFEILRREGKKE